MKNKSLIIIVLSLFFVAGIYDAEKSYAKNKVEDHTKKFRILLQETPFNRMDEDSHKTYFYRPIYIKAPDLQKSKEKNLTTPLR